ncbi:phosphohistidine phosphatase SixA [Neptunicella sp. SCSIO 80796]|uniref:phosphohistidine phosphatase SixA n=1 Tax=Neptunicella plasticusilytica TaxID=3117012 RepID=UPI003A4E2E00
MNLYIMRHGDAEQSSGKDSLRALTAKGQQEALTAGQWLQQYDHNISLALVSPYKRTQQTFAKVHQSLPSARQLTTEELVPDATPANVQDLLDGILLNDPGTQSVLLVSHMPLVCYLVDTFTGQHGPLFATASIIHIEYDKDTHIGELKFCYHVPSLA